MPLLRSLISLCIISLFIVGLRHNAHASQKKEGGNLYPEFSQHKGSQIKP